MKTRRSVILSMTLALGLAGCGDSPTDAGDDLSSAEAGALAAAILDLTIETSLSQTGTGLREGGAAAAPTSFDESTSVEGPCPLGGTMKADLHVTGTADDATGAAQLDIDVTAEHKGCKVRTEETNQLFELDGKPSIKADFHLATTANQTFTLSGGYNGAVGWSVDDGRSGTCSFDLDFSGSVNPETGSGTATLEGTACGVSITYDVSG